MDKARSSELNKYQTAVFHGMIGISEVMQQMFRKIEIHAHASAPIVISGETGSGKELVARAIHSYSGRRDKPFVAFNCTALNEELLESELFGHERGAFTGATRSHKGRFERADKGVLFLDEIGDMSPRTQVKLLRVLEDNKIERIGGETEISVDVRIIAATNISLEKIVALGRFRSDLYHRIAVLRIHVPALRERVGDIPLLVAYFLDILNRRYHKNILRLSPDALRLLSEYHWPGNVRELRNVIERVYVETEGKIIGRNAFKEWEKERDYLATGQWSLHFSESQRLSRMPIVPPVSGTKIIDDRDPWSEFYPDTYPGSRDTLFPSKYRYRPALPAGKPLDPRIVEGEFRETEVVEQNPISLTKDVLKKALLITQGNITKAAHMLNIHKSTIYRYLKKHGITRQDLQNKNVQE